jgi:hypothetical protein
MSKSIAGLCAALLLASTGCVQILSGLIDGAAHAAGNRVGSAIGDRVGEAMVRSWTPQFMTWYTSYIFALAFSAGGYSVTTVDYRPGEFTRWNLPTDDREAKESWVERAYLFDDEQGRQWWKVKFFDGASGDLVTLEGLFDMKEGRLVRLRGKFPKDQEPKEMAVDEGTYYTPPRALSKESLAGATKGPAKVQVPAGSFDTRHVLFGDGGGNSHEWWLFDGVPGGVVKHVVSSSTRGEDGVELDRSNYVLLLQAYGKGAASELGSK